MLTIVTEGIENFRLTLGDIAWIIGLILTATTLILIFKDRRDKKHAAEIAKIEIARKEESDRLREEKEKDLKRYDAQIQFERQCHAEALVKREEEVKTLVGIGGQLNTVSQTVLEIKSMMDTNRDDIRKLTEDHIETKGKVAAAWKQIEKHEEEITRIETNCQQIQNRKVEMRT
jgi:chromosome segregation ATPase